jgi:hypothetical protein
MGSPRLPRVRARAALAAVAAGALLSALAAPQAAAQPGSNPDQIDKSPNIELVASLPFQAPFNAGSVGTDLAFSGDFAYAGNFSGFTVYDISQPTSPAIAAQVLCPGSQNDISVSGDLLVLSTDSSRSDASCSSTAQSATIASSWEGLKIFDVSDPRNPQYVASVETDCGSHTHTLLPDDSGENLYVYVSSYFPVATFPDCQPPFDAISVVKVPRANPAAAAVVDQPVVFPDGGNPGDPVGYRASPQQPGPVFGTVETSGCHDITVYPSKDLAAGACMGDGVLFDISDPERPVVTERVTDDENFFFWHSATFNNAGTKVVFTDELFGGVGAGCTAAIGPTIGADAIYSVLGHGSADPALVRRGFFKIPRAQGDAENCVAHNGSLIPVPGRDIMVQAWYQGGLSVWDFTNARKPEEIAHFDRGALPGGAFGGIWSAYYYNGYIYSSDITRGLDVFKLRDRRTDAAERVVTDELNVQSQTRYRQGG